MLSHENFPGWRGAPGLLRTQADPCSQGARVGSRSQECKDCCAKEVNGVAATLTAQAGPVRRRSGQDPRGALVSAITRFFCVGETVAVPLFRMLRERARVPVARRALDRILRDEARHRQFGWDTLDWLLLHDEDDVARRVAIELPAVLADVKAAYGTAHDQPSPTLREDVMAWGMAGPAEYGLTLAVALDRDVVPRFSARGLAVVAEGLSPD